jgi:hypothetical protein
MSSQSASRWTSRLSMARAMKRDWSYVGISTDTSDMAPAYPEGAGEKQEQFQG